MPKEDDDGNSPNGHGHGWDDDDVTTVEEDTADAVQQLRESFEHLQSLVATGGSLAVNFDRLSEASQRGVLESAGRLFRDGADELHNAARLAEALVRLMDQKESRR